MVMIVYNKQAGVYINVVVIVLGLFLVLGTSPSLRGLVRVHFVWWFHCTYVC